MVANLSWLRSFDFTLRGYFPLSAVSEDTTQVLARVVMSTGDEEFARLAEPMFVDFFRTLDIRRNTLLAGCPIDLDVMH